MDKMFNFQTTDLIDNIYFNLVLIILSSCISEVYLSCIFFCRNQCIVLSDVNGNPVLKVTSHFMHKELKKVFFLTLAQRSQ